MHTFDAHTFELHTFQPHTFGNGSADSGPPPDPPPTLDGDIEMPSRVLPGLKPQAIFPHGGMT